MSSHQEKDDDDKDEEEEGLRREREEHLRIGVCSRVALPSAILERSEEFIERFSQVSPENMSGEGDQEYGFYRNILEEEDFPFVDVLTQEIADTVERYYAKLEEIRLDDAFCIHYNTSQDDTTCAKHMDPSDITINMCLEKSEDCEGSRVVFYGQQQTKQGSAKPEASAADTATSFAPNETFAVDQQAGHATIHWGCHPHRTEPLKRGRRTNIVLTYCYKDGSKSGAISRTCYESSTVGGD